MSDWEGETIRDIMYGEIRYLRVLYYIFIQDCRLTSIHRFHQRQVVNVNNANNFLPHTTTTYSLRCLRTPQGQLGRAEQSKLTVVAGRLTSAPLVHSWTKNK